jgi:hypothetical protein
MIGRLVGGTGGRVGNGHAAPKYLVLLLQKRWVLQERGKQREGRRRAGIELTELGSVDRLPD